MKKEELTLEEKIGQMLIIGVNEKKVTNKTIEMIEKYKVGGFILYKDNYQNYEEMVNLVNKLKQTNSNNKVPLFISIDQEGGRVYRMPPEIVRIKNAKAFAETKNIEIVGESGTVTGKMLKQTGINMNYSPVLDIGRYKDDDAIGNRSYGKDENEVSIYGIEVMKKLQEQKVISVVKHFPGHGASKLDSHFQIPVIKKKIETLEKEDIKPFKIAIENGADTIMVGHLILEDVDKKYPASLSKTIIQDYLRNKYKFGGLIISDDIKMLAIRLHYSLRKTIISAINAGDNIILAGYSYGKIKKIINIVKKEIENGKISIDKIEDSVEKILKIKEKYNITDARVNGAKIENINDEINKLNEKVLK